MAFLLKEVSLLITLHLLAAIILPRNIFCQDSLTKTSLLWHVGVEESYILAALIVGYSSAVLFFSHSVHNYSKLQSVDYGGTLQ